MEAYIDTSALVKLYYPEPESEALANWVRTHLKTIEFTPIHRLEIMNAFSLKVFRKELQPDELRDVRKVIESDIASGVLHAVNLDYTTLLISAEEMAIRHTKSLGTRCLDILHVAAARLLKCTDFISHDERQLKLAATIGLNVIALHSLR